MEHAMALPNTQIKALYKAAGIMALLIAIAGLVDAMTSNMGAGAQENSATGIVEWFALFQTNRFAAFSSLGVINIITLSLGIPIYLAFYQAYRQERPALGALAAILFLTGVTVYYSSNTVFSLFALSQQYATAPELQKPVLEAAGTALLAQGADLTPGTFMGFFLTQLAGILITSAMLRSTIFGKWTGAMGLAGYSLMMVFFTLAAFMTGHFDTALAFAMPGGLILMVYQVLLARRFFQLGR